MTEMPTGLLLPADVLTQPWFGVFGLFVAFNTIIYLGLTAAKFLPWPAQVQPRQVRQLLPHTTEGIDMKTPRRSEFRALGASARDLRETQAAQTIPLAMALVGALTAAVGMLYVLLYYADEGPAMLVGPLYGLILIVLSLALTRARLHPRFAVWSWTLVMLGFITETSWRASVLDSAVPLAFTVVALGFTAPIALSWPAGLFAAVTGAIPIIIAGAEVSVVDTLSWTLAAISAALSSVVLLYLRVVSLDQIAEEQERANSLASTDPLTGTFSRTGLITLAPSIADAAATSGSDVSVVTCTLPDLSRINAEYGFEYGGDVLGATARALRASLPPRAIVARWSGDQFLAVMAGNAPPRDVLHEDIVANLDLTGIALGKRPLTITVGTATGTPDATTLEALVAEAELASA